MTRRFSLLTLALALLALPVFADSPSRLLRQPTLSIICSRIGGQTAPAR